MAQQEIKNNLRITTERELVSINTEAYINRTELTDLFEPNGIALALIAGQTKIGKMALKDIAIALSKQSPITAIGTFLDDSADLYGISDRYASNRSSVVVKLIADSGTTYLASNDITFTTASGIEYNLIEDVTVGDKGYIFTIARSSEYGVSSQVSSFEIENITNEPVGHIAVTNPYKSSGGRDNESDENYRNRILNGANTFTSGTLEKFKQIMLESNNNVLRLYSYGTGANGKINLAVATKNGAVLTSSEISILETAIRDYLSFSDLPALNSTVTGVQLNNIEYEYIDVDYRVKLDPSVEPLNYIIEVQDKFAEYVDWTSWENGIDSIQWDDLLEIAKNSEGALSIPDQYFSPSSDIKPDRNKLPRFRNFTLRDLSGNLILDQNSGLINPVYYPEILDEDFTNII